jgi:DNA-binding MarR family transcriptional regulator
VPEKPDDPLELRVLRAVRRMMRAVDIHSRRLAASWRITGPQLVCLATIAREEGLSSAALARAVHLSPSTVVGILDRLEARGWVRRERGREDRRVVLLSVTPSGRELLERAPSPLQEQLLGALRSLPEQRRERIAEVLDEVVDLMEAREIDAAPFLESGSISGDDASLRRPGGDPLEPGAGS